MSHIKEYIGCKSIEAADYDGNNLYSMWLTDTEVVRCRDCKHLVNEECHNDIWRVAYGEGYPVVVPDIGIDDGFCAWGERREA